MHPFLHDLETSFIKFADVNTAQKQSAYLRGKFPFFGIKKPQVQAIVKDLLKKHPISSSQELYLVLESLWDRKQREFHASALLVTKKNVRLWEPHYLSLFEKMIRIHSWWDTVDEIAAHLVGNLLIKYPHLQKRMDDWIQDPFLWIRRSALLHQLAWKDQTNPTRLFKYCENLISEKEFFIRKAIGWVLRQYSKTCPSAVQTFVDDHRSSLSPLSLKEATKYLP